MLHYFLISYNKSVIPYLHHVWWGQWAQLYQITSNWCTLCWSENQYAVKRHVHNLLLAACKDCIVWTVVQTAGRQCGSWRCGCEGANVIKKQVRLFGRWSKLNCFKYSSFIICVVSNLRPSSNVWQFSLYSADVPLKMLKQTFSLGQRWESKFWDLSCTGPMNWAMRQLMKCTNRLLYFVYSSSLTCQPKATPLISSSCWPSHQ